MHFWNKLILAGTLLAGIPQAQAQDFPERNVRIVVSLGAGSSLDLLTRQLARRLEEKWGKPVVVENKPGAGGMLAAEYVSKQAPDGYTWLMSGPSLIAGKLLNSRLTFDPMKDLMPLARLINLRIVLATNTDVPAQNMQEFVKYARANPGRLNYAGAGRTSIIDTGIEVITRGFGLSLTGVPFPGAPQHITALIRNDVQLVWAGSAVMREQLGTNRVRLLASVSERRLADMPDLPTVVEAGYAGFVPTIWNGLFVPAGTDPSLVRRIHKDIEAVLSTPEAVKMLGDVLGMDAAIGTPDELRAQMERELAFWRDMFGKLEIKSQ
jgi:tripartite-type tricarboxylate transporter receptor subunit TctC